MRKSKLISENLFMLPKTKLTYRVMGQRMGRA